MLTTAIEAAKRIKAGERLLLAAEEKQLLALPRGTWIGGTIPYFMGEQGGQVSREAVFVTPLPPEIGEIEIALYDSAALPRVAAEAPENGITFLILPSSSKVHLEYAQNAPDYKDMYMKPIVGWVAGTHLDDLGSATPKVVDGREVRAYADKAIALHGTLPPGMIAKLGIINLFKQGKGEALTFPNGGFKISRCFVNGSERSFSKYLSDAKIDTKLPLVADYSGALVNVSFQSVDPAKDEVSLYAPVFTGVKYRIAEPVDDYVASFSRALPRDIHPIFACNCILNFLYSELEGKITEGMTGPVTFGEIAYQLLNQTLVYVTIEKS
jgi:hypothetical protein